MSHSLLILSVVVAAAFAGLADPDHAELAGDKETFDLGKLTRVYMEWSGPDFKRQAIKYTADEGGAKLKTIKSNVPEPALAANVHGVLEWSDSKGQAKWLKYEADEKKAVWTKS